MDIDTSIQYINVEEIIPNRFQPRLTFDDEGLQELAKSINEHGIIQPLVLRKLLNGKYEIIAGERRYKASQIAGLSKVPSIIANLDDNTSAEVALVENLQRRNLSSIEEAKSYKKLLDRGYLTQEQLAKRLGVSQSGVANKVRLLNLTEEVQDALLKELISERHARSLLQITNKEQQINMLNKIINNRLTVRQLDEEIKKKLNGEENAFDTQYEDVTKLIDESKKSLDNQYEIFDIPTGEEISTKQSKETTIEKGNINSIINKIKELEQEIKNCGFQIETEDYDFEDLYQVIIKIDK